MLFLVLGPAILHIVSGFLCYGLEDEALEHSAATFSAGAVSGALGVAKSYSRRANLILRQECKANRNAKVNGLAEHITEAQSNNGLIII